MTIVWIITVIVALLLLPVVLLRIISPGKTPPITDARGKKVPGSIAEIETLQIGGVTQCAIIRGQNVNNPVLLYVHGGPGTPEFAFVRREFAALEKHFTICYWEQRGAGKSAGEAAGITLEQLVSDAAEVTLYLQQRFHCGKVHLLGHSWGTVLGVHAAKAFPDLFACYIGIGQVCNQFEGERLSLEFVRDQARQLKHTSVPGKVEKLQLPARDAAAETWINYLLKQRRWVGEFGGALFRSNLNKTAPKQLITCPEYTLREKLAYMAKARKSMLQLWPCVISNDLAQVIPTLEIPVYIIQGLHDYQTPLKEARRFYDNLSAPHKAWFELEEAAHFPHTECYAAFEQYLLTEVLSPKN
ncbi:MAG: alpha/beta hydrolase [Bacteroidetes bacterium]|nr:alpha/beta hydrolase [Bacteroidota bacterium]